MSPRNPPKVIALVTVARKKVPDIYFGDVNFLRECFGVCLFLFERRKDIYSPR